MEKEEKLLDYLEGLDSMMDNGRLLIGTVICHQDDLESVALKTIESGYCLFDQAIGSAKDFKNIFSEKGKLLIIVKDGKYVVTEKDYEDLAGGIIVILFSKEEYEKASGYQKIEVSSCSLS